MAIIVTRPGVKAQKLSRAPVTAERDLQAYIVDNPECLPIEELGEDLRLLVLAREVPTGAGPIDAVGTDQDKKFVFVVDADNKVVYRPIQLGAMAEGRRVVESGLKVGDKIVVNGLQRIRPGAIVAPELEQKVAAAQ